MTPEQMAQIKQEITTFSEKSIQYATDNHPELSAHYNRLYRSSQVFLDKMVKMEQSLIRKKHAEARRLAKQKTGTSTGTTVPNAPRQSA